MDVGVAKLELNAAKEADGLQAGRDGTLLKGIGRGEWVKLRPPVGGTPS